MDLKKLKGLLGIPESDTTQDAALQFLMEDVDETIQNYCNLKAVPAGLTSTSYSTGWYSLPFVLFQHGAGGRQ